MTTLNPNEIERRAVLLFEHLADMLTAFRRARELGHAASDTDLPHVLEKVSARLEAIILAVDKLEP
jgi:hypothetical protein